MLEINSILHHLLSAIYNTFLILIHSSICGHRVLSTTLH